MEIDAYVMTFLMSFGYVADIACTGAIVARGGGVLSSPAISSSRVALELQRGSSQVLSAGKGFTASDIDLETPWS